MTLRWYITVIGVASRIVDGRTESKQRYPIRFDRIRSYLHRPQRTRGHRRSKYTRG